MKLLIRAVSFHVDQWVGKHGMLILAGLLSVFIVASAGFAQERGVRLVTPASTADALPTENRFALVVGNADYTSSALRNPKNDAQKVAETLRDLGFEVDLRFNLDQRDMRRAIIAFGRSLKHGGVGLFYYAGHGMQVDGHNYLIPVHSEITTEEEVESDAVDVTMILSRMRSADNRMNIVILDACRTNPFKRSFRSGSQGLASIDAPTGTIISYATAPGGLAEDGVGDNSTFTEALIQHLRTPGLPIEGMFKAVRASVLAHTDGKQTPWEASSLVGEFYFARDTRSEFEFGGVVCPAGTVPRGDRCVARIDRSCPIGATFVENQGCVGRVAPKPKAAPPSLDWIRIAGGVFEMGSLHGGRDETPVHRVRLSTFEIAKTETTVAQYRRCVEAGLCSGAASEGNWSEYLNWGKSARGNHPINGINWHQAQTYCEWAGGRLPTESEWV